METQQYRNGYAMQRDIIARLTPEQIEQAYRQLFAVVEHPGPEDSGLTPTEAQVAAGRFAALCDHWETQCNAPILHVHYLMETDHLPAGGKITRKREHHEADRADVTAAAKHWHECYGEPLETPAGLIGLYVFRGRNPWDRTKTETVSILVTADPNAAGPTSWYRVDDVCGTPTDGSPAYTAAGCQ